MASSGAFSGGGGYQGRTLEFHWYETGSSIQNNTRTIHWELRAAGGSSSYYYHHHEHLYIDGVEVYGNDARTKRYAGVIASGDRTFTHDAAGNKTFSVRIFAAVYTSSYNVDNTGYFGLDNIARQANITNSIVSFNDEENPWFDYSNPGNWSCRAWLEPNPSGPHYAERIVTGTSGRYTWDLSSAERKQLRQACKGNSCTIRIGLYSNGNTWASCHDRTYTIKNPMPIVGNPTWKSTNLATLADTATVIKAYSNIDVDIPVATAVKEATITQYKVVCGTIEKTSTTPGIISLMGVNASTIHVYVTDSRGNVVEKILSILKYIEYEKPMITYMEFERSDGGIGTQVEMTYKGTMWVGDFGKLTNTLTAQYYYKEQGASTWITGVTVINPTVTTDFAKTISIKGDLGALGFDAGKNYDFKIVITDRIGAAAQAEKIGILTSGVPTTAYHPNGFCIGGFYNENEGGSFQIEGKRQPVFELVEIVDVEI